MKGVESQAQTHFTPAGKLPWMDFIFSLTALETSSALASGASWMPKAAIGVAPMVDSEPYCAAPSVTRATSLSRTEAPFGSVRSRICSNCSGELNRPSTVTVAVVACSRSAGQAPTEPEANWAFCDCTAASTADADRL